MLNKFAQREFIEWAVVTFKSTFSKREKRIVLAALLLSLSLNLLEVIGILLVGFLGILAIEGVSGIQSPKPPIALFSLLGLGGLSLQLQITILAFIAAFLLTLRTTLSIIFFRRFYVFLARKSSEISMNVLRNLLNATLDIFEKKSTQSWYLGILKSVNVFYTKIISSLTSIFIDSILVFFIIVGILTYDLVTGLLTIVFFIFVALTLTIFSARETNRLSSHELAQETLIGQDFRDLLSGYKEFAHNRRMVDRIQSIQQGYRSQSTANARLSMIPLISKYVFEASILIGVLLFAGLMFLIFDATVAFGGISIFMIAATRIVPGIARIQTNLNMLSSAKPSLLLLREISSDIPLEDNFRNLHSTVSGALKSNDGALVVKNLEFVRGKFSLRCDHLTIALGQKAAIIGSSGAGKSTFLDLVAGLREPVKGEILFSGVSIKEFESGIDNKVAYVPQDITLIRGSLRQNLLITPDKSQDGEAVKLLIELDLWKRFDSNDGLDTDVSKFHGQLSGGERQRLGIARALLQKPALLILDEFTSSLDEENALKALDILVAEKHITVLAATHSKGSLKYFDRLIEISGGLVKELDKEITKL